MWKKTNLKERQRFRKYANKEEKKQKKTTKMNRIVKRKKEIKAKKDNVFTKLI